MSKTHTYVSLVMVWGCLLLLGLGLLPSRSAVTQTYAFDPLALTPTEPPTPTPGGPTLTPTPTATPIGQITPTATPRATLPPRTPTNTPVPVEFADPRIRKVVSGGNFVVGSEMDFVLTVGLSGTVSADDVVVTDLLPDFLVILGVTTSRGDYTVTGNSVTVYIGTMAPGEVVTIVVRARAIAPATGSNSASVASSSPTDDPNNNDSSVEVIVGPGSGFADPWIRKVVSGGNFVVGNEMEFTLTVGVNGTLPAADVVVTDVLPAFLEILGISTSRGDYAVTGNNVTVYIGTMAPGELVTIVVRARAIAPATGSNRASVSTSSPTDNPGNNNSSVEVIVGPGSGFSDPRIRKVVSGSNFLVGEEMDFTITAVLVGTLPANDVIVTDTLPAFLEVLGVTTTRGASTVAGNSVTVSIGTMAPGEQITIVVRARAIAPASGSNNARISSSSPTDDPGNNNSSVGVVVGPGVVGPGGAGPGGSGPGGAGPGGIAPGSGGAGPGGTRPGSGGAGPGGTRPGSGGAGPGGTRPGGGIAPGPGRGGSGQPGSSGPGGASPGNPSNTGSPGSQPNMPSAGMEPGGSANFPLFVILIGLLLVSGAILRRRAFQP